MKPNILVLTLHNPLEFDFRGWLSETNFEYSLSLCVDAESVSEADLHEFAETQKFSFAKRYDNYLNNGLIWSDLQALHLNEPFTAVIAFGEDDILRAAYLRKAWNLAGQTPENGILFRDKVACKKALRAVNLHSPAFCELGRPEDLLNFVAENKLAVYVKPRSASGSVFGKKIQTALDLEQFLATGFQPRIPFSEYVSDLCVEVFQDGEMYHIDGLCLNSEIPFVWPSKYLTPGLQIQAFAAGAVVGSFMLEQNNPLFLKITNYVIAVCEALKLPNGHTFHAEVFIDKFENISLCEIACRTGGGRINQALIAAGGPDLNAFQFLAQSAMGLESELIKLVENNVPTQLVGWMLIPPQPGICQKLPDFSDVKCIVCYEISIKIGDTGWNRAYSGDSMGYVIVSGKTENELKNNMNTVLKLVSDDLKFST